MKYFMPMLSAIWCLAACSVSPPLKRPILAKGEEAFAVSFYAYHGSESGRLPRTQRECLDYLKQPLAGAPDSLVAAVCYLNLDNYDSAQTLARTQDGCLRKVLQYDIEVEKGLSGTDRFMQLQSMLDCSQDPLYTRMIRNRGKLAHYE
jgi:hypothetical protein